MSEGKEYCIIISPDINKCRKSWVDGWPDSTQFILQLGLVGLQLTTEKTSILNRRILNLYFK